MPPPVAHPPDLGSFDVQERRCLNQLAAIDTDLEKFIYLSGLRIDQPHQFYRLLSRHFEQLAPLIYTPTVGDACLQWSSIYRRSEGLYLSYERDRGKVVDVLRDWPQKSVTLTVITDGSRILGLGDLGVNGMGIPIGKLSLYVGCGGVDPREVLPLTVDLGTNNEKLRKSEMYVGSRQPKQAQAEEQGFLDEIMAALAETWPNILVQFEDWKVSHRTPHVTVTVYTSETLEMAGVRLTEYRAPGIPYSGLHPNFRCLMTTSRALELSSWEV
jgi:malate dehydrogenase (oxaloacetate-decarboxylating)(NADP+)